MDHWEYKQAVNQYRMKSGHAINYYDGGYSATDTGAVTARPVQKGSLAKDKMRDLHGRADGSMNRGKTRKNVMAEINDTQ